MEYVELLLIIKKNYIKLLLSSVAGFVLSLSYYFVSDESYITEGTLFVYPINSASQKQEVTSDMNFARNIIGISESPEFRNFTLGKLESDVNYIPLVGLSVGIKLKEVTPNLVSLSLKEISKEKSEKKFQIYKESLIEFSKKLNKGNSKF
jgi:hypothetical protein